MNSKWQIHRIGLVNFWYYDEQEFYFLKGRMLLRGANGSGKSVTMQSFIPLLLDGNMRPERLDPFGSRARKMENYMLEEEDSRPERIGYLYMEFKRRDSDTFLTIGIGLRARPAKKLETWYFYLSDGRRVGKEFRLYKDMGSKIVLTKLELRNRIGDGGQVLENQRDYMYYVNKLVFGFETLDEYREMLELLIQLRTPKLSKEFRPSLINEILSSALQPLSEDDLRPMSEAIENMDALKTNLENLRESAQAAGRIRRVYGRYNESSAWEKADAFLKAKETLQDREDRGRALEERIRLGEAKWQETSQHRRMLEEEQALLKEEQAALGQSDARQLLEQERSLQEELASLKEDRANKEKALEEKREKRVGLAGQRREKEALIDGKREDLVDCLAGMGELMPDVPFDEYAFLEHELRQNLDAQYDFQGHSRMADVFQERLEAGTNILREEQSCQKIYDDALFQLDEARKERDAKERELAAYDNQLTEIRQEWLEQLYQWNRDNLVFKLPDGLMQELGARLLQIGETFDYQEFREPVREEKNRLEDDLRAQRAGIQEELSKWQERLQEKEADLQEWENMADPKPPCGPEVLKNRKKLEEHNIPFTPFYEAVDFLETLPENQRNRLEEALFRMGVLNALIVPEQEREKVLALGGGSCDQYIFAGAASARDNLLQLLEIDNRDNDIFFYHAVSTVLSGIGYMDGHHAAVEGRKEGQVGQPLGDPGEDSHSALESQRDGHHTVVDDQGNYQLGILTGTVTGDYKAKYIGARAREAYRQSVIEQLRQERDALALEVEHIAGRLQGVEEQLRRLSEEWERFPSGEDLKTAHRDYQAIGRELQFLKNQVQQLTQKLEKVEAQLRAVREQVQKLCGNIGLSPRLDLFLQAEKSFKAYRELFSRLQILHASYLEAMVSHASLEDQIGDLDGDLDDLLHDQSQLDRKYARQSENLKRIQEQLQRTDYAQVRERLEFCVSRLAAIPEELLRKVEELADLKNALQQNREKQQENEVLREKAALREQTFLEGFVKELRLAYLPWEEIFAGNQAFERWFSPEETPKERGDQKEQKKEPEGLAEQKKQDMAALAHQVAERFWQSSGQKRRVDLLAQVQQVYHENVGYLREYNMNLETLFDGEGTEDFSFSRLNILAKYRGAKVTFPELLARLERDIEEQAGLLSDKDRELFEDILANTISKKIRAKIYSSDVWVDKMNQLMESMHTSSGLTLNLRWKSKRAEHENQMDTAQLVKLLKKDAEIMREEEVQLLSRHFRSKIEEARKLSDEQNFVQSFHNIMRDVLDYRKWFEFQLECRKTGENKKELTDRVFYTFSGGEKAMAMYVPLFSAVVAKYQGARSDAPRLISLDEAFAGVDEMNIQDMFRLMVEFDFDFIINSQILYGDYETVPALAIYQLVRPQNARFVTVITYAWNGKVRALVERPGELEE